MLEPERPIDETLWEELEELLIAADLGAAMAADFVNRGREEVMFGTVTRAGQLRPVLRRFLLDTLGPARPLALDAHPSVVLVLGVNGSGKTTTCAKLAAALKADGRHVLLAAADTFRAAAIEQLETWGQRIDVEVVRQAAGSDPAAVVFDAVKAATARSADVLVIDTAGRLHTKSNLMDELGKLKRVVQRQLPGAPHESLLVLDAPTGQNGFAQARMFHEAVGLSGVVSHQARRHRQGRDRGADRPRAEAAGAADRGGREGRRPAAVRSRPLRGRAGPRVNDAAFMRHALGLAERGRGLTSPNPMVGAVVVREGRVVGEGAHLRAGGDHAEVVALAAAGAAARGATLYVTLEPCAHHGRTPPCAPTVARAGVARVVIALADPNPRVVGGGADLLRAAGIAVELGVEAAAAERQNRAWLTAMRGAGRTSR